MSLNTGRWIEPTAGAGASADVVWLASEVNRWIGISLTFATVITLAMAIFELARLVTRLRQWDAATIPA